MVDDAFERFTNTLHTLVPEFSMGAEEIKTQIQTLGIDGFIDSMGGDAAELVEAVELISRVGTEGVRNELGTGGVKFESE